MAIEKVINIKVNTGDTKAQLSDVKKGTDEISASSGALTSKLDSMTGGALTGFKSMVGGLRSVAIGFKGIGTAIALSGIGLLIITIAAVTAAFKSSEEGQNKFAKLMGIIGSVTGNLIDLLSDFGEVVISVFENPQKAIRSLANAIKDNITNRITGLIELFPKLGEAISLTFEGKFKEAGKVAADAIGKVGLGVNGVSDKLKGLVKGTKAYAKQIADDAKSAAKVANDRAYANKLERDFTIQNEKDRNKINLLREKSIQLDKYSAAERAKFLKEANDIDDKSAIAQTKIATLRANAKTLENSLSKSTSEALDEEAQLKAKVIQIDNERLSGQRRLSTQIQSLQKEDLASQKTLSDEKQKIRDEEAKKDAEYLKKLADEKLVAEMESAKNAFQIVDELNKSRETPAQKEQREYEEKLAVLDENNLNTELLKEIHLERLAEIERLAKEKEGEDKVKAYEADLKAEEDLAKQKKDIKHKALEDLQFIAGSETAIGKAVLIAKQAVATQELILNIKSTINAAKTAVTKSTLKASEAGVDIATGAAKTVSAAPFPANIPLIIGYAATAVGIVSSIKAAMSKVKGANSGSIGEAPREGATPSAPSFNLVQGTASNQIAQSISQSNAPIKAYVVSTDMTTNQSLDRNILNNSRIG